MHTHYMVGLFLFCAVTNNDNSIHELNICFFPSSNSDIVVSIVMVFSEMSFRGLDKVVRILTLKSVLVFSPSVHTAGLMSTVRSWLHTN